MKKKSDEEVANLILDCQHGSYFCAYEFLALFVDESNFLFNYYTQEHTIMKRCEEIYELSPLEDDKWLKDIRDFMLLFCMTFQEYNEIDLLILLGKKRALKIANIVE